MSEVCLETEELLCSSRLVPLTEFPFSESMQTTLNGLQHHADAPPAGCSPDQPAKLRPGTHTPDAACNFNASRLRQQPNHFLEASGHPQVSSSSVRSPMIQVRADCSTAAPPTKLPPLEHMLALPRVINADVDEDIASGPAQRLRPASALRLEARLAAAQQQGMGTQQQPNSFTPRDGAAASPLPASEAALRSPASVSPAGMSVHNLVAAARAARQLEAEVQRLEAERRSLQGRLAAEATQHQHCSAALDEARLAQNRCPPCLVSHVFVSCLFAGIDTQTSTTQKHIDPCAIDLCTGWQTR